MTRLSVNVNKLATLRNSRGKNLPDVAAYAEKIIGFGAHGITVHPRPDGRHIRAADVLAISQLIARHNRGSTQVEFNIEGFPSTDFIELVGSVKPHQATLVPDPPEALTSNAGWDLAGREALLQEVLAALKKAAPATKISLFVDPENFGPEQLAALGRLRPERIELYTEAFHDHFTTSEQEAVTARYVKAAEQAKQLGIGVNAGHDLNQKNLKYLVQKIPWLHEVSIGHALVCEALDDGFEKTIRNYLRLLEG